MYVYYIYKCINITYTLYSILMSTCGIVVTQYIGWGCQSPNPTKCTVYSGNFVFNLCDALQECNPAVKQDLPILHFFFLLLLLLLLQPPPSLSPLLLLITWHPHTQQNVILCSKLVTCLAWNLRNKTYSNLMLETETHLFFLQTKNVILKFYVWNFITLNAVDNL
jgi:hypothetical protein